MAFSKTPLAPEAGIAEAVRLAGSQAQLARMLGVAQQTVAKWVRRGYAARRHVAPIEAMTGVSRRRLIDPRLLDLVGDFDLGA